MLIIICLKVFIFYYQFLCCSRSDTVQSLFVWFSSVWYYPITFCIVFFSLVLPYHCLYCFLLSSIVLPLFILFSSVWYHAITFCIVFFSPYHFFFVLFDYCSERFPNHDLTQFSFQAYIWQHESDACQSISMSSQQLLRLQ